MADTPADHAAMADWVRANAAAAREEIRLHKYMARSIHSGKRRVQLGDRHCEKLAKRYRAMAEEYDGLAKLHDEQTRMAR